MTIDSFVCPVCGHPGLEDPPRMPSGGGSYEICWSCGFEFGWTDDAYGALWEPAFRGRVSHYAVVG